MLFIEKQGAYSHGIWWIGESQDKGLKELEKLSEADTDSYHEWQLLEFLEQDDDKDRWVDYDPEHKLIATKKKGQDTNFK